MPVKKKSIQEVSELSVIKWRGYNLFKICDSTNPAMPGAICVESQSSGNGHIAVYFVPENEIE